MFVYVLRNNVNGKLYVGQTKLTLERRWLNHRKHSRDRRRTNPISCAIRKYGYESFSFVESIECETRDQLCRFERQLIAEYQTQDKRFGYNLSAGGDGNFNPSESTRKKLRDANLGEKSPRWGKKHSAATRALMSKKATENNPMKGRKLSEAHIRAISKASKGNNWRWRFGNKASAKTVRKMSKGIKKNWQINHDAIVAKMRATRAKNKLTKE